MQASVDAISLNFDAGTLLALNIIMAMIMFGVALSLRVSDFRDVLKRPRAPIIGCSWS